MTAAPAILVVDDDPVNRTLLARTLEALGHRVLTATNGREALDALRAEVPDIVLLDIVMPELDGMAVLEHIKADPALRAVPVIMISALEDFDRVVRCIELGAEDYLQKPFDAVLLRARIRAGLDKRRLQQLERDRVRDVFARFLPEPMVDEVLSRADGDLRLGGVRVLGTAMFADLRSFTTFAERTPPDQVIAVLNRYLGEMSDAVLDHGGTLVAFLGDGLLAVFGAPVQCEDHADRAVAAAREMVDVRLPRFNEWARERGYDGRFRMGIGMCSGPLMSGNVGSERRLEYTAIGDTVNTASRIESLTKELGHPVLVSESTLELATDPPEDLVYVDEVTVRGRSTPTRVWGLAARVAVAGAVVALGLFSGCGGKSSSETSAAAATQTADPATDKLAQILARGTLVGYHEKDYPPQSMDVKGAKRPTGTKCAETQLTGNQVTGFDSETTKLVAAGLGVEACFATPTWTEVTAGNWSDRWDIAYGSGSINADRMERLYMTQPYYAVPNYYFVARRSAARHAADLDGERIGACASCSHELYLNGELEIPGIRITVNVADPKVVTYETEGPGLVATAKGRIDAFLAAEPVGQAKIDEGLALRRLPETAFTYFPSGFVDKSSGLDSRPFMAKVDEIVQGAQADGTLTGLSRRFFGRDYIPAAAAYDIDAIDQGAP